MSTEARFSGRALREIAAVTADLEHEAAARTLRAQLETAAQMLGRHPELGRREPSLADVRYRVWSVSGFPYVLVYRADRTPPPIVRFVHAARDLPRVLTGLRGDPPG